MLNINFIKKDSRPRLMIGGIVGALSVSGLLIGLMISSMGTGSLSANISDSLAKPSAMPGAQYPAAPSVPKSITDTPAASVALGSAGDSVRYFEAQTGRAFQIDLKSRQTTVISDKKIPGFAGATWSPEKNTFVPTDRNRASLVFSPNGQKIAYLHSDGDVSLVTISAVDGTDARTVLATRAVDPIITWPLDATIVMSSRQLDQAGRDITLVGLDSSLVPLASNLTNLEMTWSRNGSTLLYSYFTPTDGVQLWYMNMAHPVPTPLTVATSAHKCAWHPDGVTITCGIPSNTSLSGDTSSANSATRDDIVTINTLTGEQNKKYSAQSGAYIGVIDPLVSSAESFFVFTNLFDQRLYTLPL